MPRKKATKKGTTGNGVRALNDLENRRPEIAQLAVSIDILTYPHILSMILGYSSTGTLATLLRCSKTLFQLSAKPLYRTIRVNPDQLKAMLDAGWAPVKNRSASGKMGETFSPSLRQCLEHTRAIHLLKHQSRFVYPNIPIGLFANTRHVIIYPSHNDIELPALFRSFDANLYMHWVPKSDLHFEYSCTHTTDPLPSSIRSVTLLMPDAYRHKQPHRIFWGGGWTSKRRHPVTTIVLMPWACEEAGHVQQTLMIDRWMSSSLSSDREVDFYVGTELSGRSQEINEVLSRCHPRREQENCQIYPDPFSRVSVSAHQGGLPLWIKTLTVLVPNACRQGSAPWVSISWKHEAVPMHVVLMPWTHGNQELGHQARMTELWSSRNWGTCDLYVGVSSYIGAESVGRVRDQWELLGADSTRTRKDRMSFPSFHSWLDELESGTVFTVEEELERRIAGAKLRMLGAEERIVEARRIRSTLDPKNPNDAEKWRKNGQESLELGYEQCYWEVQLSKLKGEYVELVGDERRGQEPESEDEGEEIESNGEPDPWPDLDYSTLSAYR